LEHPEGDKNRIRLTNMAFPFGRPIVEVWSWFSYMHCFERKHQKA
jgi:hypothetical protein